MMGKMIFGKLLGIMLGMAILAGPVSAVTQSGQPIGALKNNFSQGFSAAIEGADLAQSVYCEHNHPADVQVSFVANKVPDLLLKKCCTICGAVTVGLRNSAQLEVVHGIYDIALTPAAIQPVFSLLKPPRV